MTVTMSGLDDSIQLSFYPQDDEFKRCGFKLHIVYSRLDGLIEICIKVIKLINSYNNPYRTLCIICEINI